jgi:hypothetical protein
MGGQGRKHLNQVLLHVYKKRDRRHTLMLTGSSHLRISGLEYENRGRAAVSKGKGDDVSTHCLYLENGLPTFCESYKEDSELLYRDDRPATKPDINQPVHCVSILRAQCAVPVAHLVAFPHANLADAFADEILPYISFSFHITFYDVTCCKTILTSEWNIIWTKVSVFFSLYDPFLVSSDTNAHNFFFEAILALDARYAFSNPDGDLASAIATT